MVQGSRLRFDPKIDLNSHICCCLNAVQARVSCDWLAVTRLYLKRQCCVCFSKSHMAKMLAKKSEWALDKQNKPRQTLIGEEQASWWCPNLKMHFCLRCMLGECGVFVKYTLHIGCCHYDTSLRLRVLGGVIITAFNYTLLRGGALAVARWGLVSGCSVWEEKYVVEYFLCELRRGFYCDSTGENDNRRLQQGTGGVRVLWKSIMVLSYSNHSSKCLLQVCVCVCVDHHSEFKGRVNSSFNPILS